MEKLEIFVVMAKYKSGDYSFETSGYIKNAMGKFTSWLCENP